MHDRQTRPGDDLPLPPVPQLQPGGAFGHQEPYAETFLELDDALGYFLNLEWRMGKRLLVRASSYNNEADPEVLERGQYGWYTEFNHVGFQLSLPGEFGVLAQWMEGTTVMGPWQGEWYPVDVAYAAAYLMLTRVFDRHRFAVRYDDFSVTDNDELPDDDNNEDGRAWTVSYQFTFSDRVRLAAEWLAIQSTRPAFAYFGDDETSTERQAQLAVRLRF